jgi:sugar phosphate isomerase/epimerase
MLRSDRRSFLKASAALTLGAALPTWGCAPNDVPNDAPTTAPSQGSADAPLYRISLAQWSLHRAFFGGDLRPLDFARTARETFDLGAVEYVNRFFMDRARDRGYLQAMKTRAEEAGVESLLIMCDGEGALGHPEAAKRTAAVNNHRKWIEAAAVLGCHSIRVNAQTLGEGPPDEQRKRAADGLRRLTEHAAEQGLNVLVENHGGLSSNGAWLADVMETVDHERCGTLPDFGNWDIREGKAYDPYEGVRALMPHARAVSAKALAFDQEGRETTLDYARLLRIVLEHGYRGYVGIEYEGDALSETDGIRATKRLLQAVRSQLVPDVS